MDDNAGVHATEVQEAFDAMRLFGFLLAVLLLPVAALLLWGGVFIPLSLSLFLAFILVVYGSAMSLRTGNQFHVVICAKLLEILGKVWAAVFLLIGVTLVILFVANYSGDMFTALEFELYMGFVLDTKPIGLMMGAIASVLIAAVSYFLRTPINFLWVQPFTRKLSALK